MAKITTKTDLATCRLKRIVGAVIDLNMSDQMLMSAPKRLSSSKPFNFQTHRSSLDRSSLDITSVIRIASVPPIFTISHLSTKVPLARIQRCSPATVLSGTTDPTFSLIKSLTEKEVE